MMQVVDAPNKTLYFSGGFQRFQKQLLRKRFSLNVHSHANGDAALARLCAPALIAFIFDDGKVPGFKVASELSVGIAAASGFQK